MGLFKKLFKKEEVKETSNGNTFKSLTVESIERLTSDSVKLTFTIPQELFNMFAFKPGQYITIKKTFNNEEVRRSYSICSAPNEGLSVGIKAVENGLFSTFATTDLKVGDALLVSAPIGNFTLKGNEKKIAAFVAGSGITPVLSIAKSLNDDQEMDLFYGNQTEQSIMFHNELTGLKNVRITFLLSREEKEGYVSGKLNKEKVSELIKQNLDLLKYDAFLLCGPEEMIVATSEVLNMFGVSKEKIHYELFTTPVLMKSETPVEENTFNGTSKVTVILDSEKIEVDLKSTGKSILETVNDKGFDAPYSCKGGVCCTCRAKVLKGKATMTLNYSLTDAELAEGYILTCQAHPASDELVISYDA